jgi:hypothetical protein
MDAIQSIADSGFRISDFSPGLNPQSAIHNPQSDKVDGGEEKKKQLAKDFESVLLTKMFDEVKESIGQWIRLVAGDISAFRGHRRDGWGRRTDR